MQKYRLAVTLTLPVTLISLSLSQIAHAEPTELQTSTADSVLNECINLPRDQGLTALQQDLDQRCSQLVINNGEFGPILTNDQLDSAYQQVATEEASAAGTVSTRTTNTQTSNVINRLSSLRRAGKALGGGAGDDNGFDKASVFVNASIGSGDKNETTREDGFEFDSRGFILGTDYRPTSDTVIGAAINHNRFDSDFKNTTTGTVLGGNLDAQSTSLSAYGSWYKNDIYVDGTLAYGKSDYDINRVIRYPGVDRIARASTEGKQLAASIGAGMNRQQGSITYGPYGRLHYQDIDIDGYAETGALGMNMTVSDQNIKSTKSVVGIHASTAMNQSFGVLSPHINLEWHHEFDDDSRQISSFFTVDPNQTAFTARTNNPDRDYFTIDGGISTVHTNGIQSFLNVAVLLGQEHIDSSYNVTGGIRVEF